MTTTTDKFMKEGDVITNETAYRYEGWKGAIEAMRAAPSASTNTSEISVLREKHHASNLEEMSTECFITALNVAANNIIEESLLKCLCAEAAKRLKPVSGSDIQKNAENYVKYGLGQAGASTAPVTRQPDGWSVRPPIDNKFVKEGCEQFDMIDEKHIRDLMVDAAKSIPLDMQYKTSAQIDAMLKAIRPYLQIEGADTEQPDSSCQEDDGCPTEKAVLQRFWRQHKRESGWQPMKTAPKDGRTILILGGFKSDGIPSVRTGNWGKDMGKPEWRDTALGGCPLQPTHWMPLPNPPTHIEGQS